MKNELRLGNWIECDHTEWDKEKKKWNKSHVQFQIDRIQMLNILHGQAAFDFIPLTKKWFTYYDFKKDKQGYYVKDKWSFLYNKRFDCWNGFISLGGDNVFKLPNLQYVHKLQNLWLELTEKELEKK